MPDRGQTYSNFEKSLEVSGVTKRIGSNNIIPSYGEKSENAHAYVQIWENTRFWLEGGKLLSSQTHQNVQKKSIKKFWKYEYPKGYGYRTIGKIRNDIVDYFFTMWFLHKTSPIGC